MSPSSPSSLSSSISPEPDVPRWADLTVNALSSLLESRAGLESVVGLRGEEAAAVIEVLDQAQDSACISSRQRKRYSTALRKLCSACGILPTSCMITEGLETTEAGPYASGGSSDVWKGSYQGQQVAIKVLRTYTTGNLAKVQKRFYKEILVWKQLRHPNVLPFQGVATSLFPFCMVSHWMANGNIVEYIEMNDGANRPLLVSDAVSGLGYLHDNDFVHGDLKGGNILITNDDRACLADFGLMKLVSDAHPTHSTTTGAVAGTVRWMAPELLIPEEFGLNRSEPSKASDIYAFGMVIFEVMTGAVPFTESNNLAVIPKVIKGMRPQRPREAVKHGLTDDVWQVMADCWHQSWKERPVIKVVSDRLAEARARFYLPSPAFVEDPEIPSDFGDESDSSSGISDDLFLPDRISSRCHVIPDDQPLSADSALPINSKLYFEKEQPELAEELSQLTYPTPPTTPPIESASPIDQQRSSRLMKMVRQGFPSLKLDMEKKLPSGGARSMNSSIIAPIPKRGIPAFVSRELLKTSCSVVSSTELIFSTAKSLITPAQTPENDPGTLSPAPVIWEAENRVSTVTSHSSKPQSSSSMKENESSCSLALGTRPVTPDRYWRFAPEGFVLL